MERKRTETRFAYIDQYCRETGMSIRDRDALNYLHMELHGLHVFKVLTGDAAQRLENDAYFKRMRRVYENELSPVINPTGNRNL